MNINDIITESHHACPHCGGPLVEYSDLMEKKDACYYKVKASAKVWPSAYASGRLVQCRKKGAANYGNKSESVAEAGGGQQAAIAIAKRESGKYSKQDGHRLKGQGVAEAQLDEKCWDGYQQQGMKNKSGRQVPNCVPVEENTDPEIEEMYEAMNQLAEEIAAKQGVSVDLVWESFEALDDHMLFETAAWRRKEGKSAKGGLNAKGVASYRRENPGSKLQTAVTTKPSKLKPGSKAAKRRKSFCARMGGVKGPMKKPNGKPTRKALALRKWNC
jgi:hypothetical protein